MSEETEMMQCPYNAAHMVLKHRMASHLIKCRQQHPTEKFATCPFNGTHDVPAPELRYHTETCPDRKQLENFMYVIDEPRPQEEPIPAIEMPESSENWDEEASSCGSYLDAKNKVLEKELILRQPVGMSRTNRKEFFRSEVQRFEDCAGHSSEASTSHSSKSSHSHSSKSSHSHKPKGPTK